MAQSAADRFCFVRHNSRVIEQVLPSKWLKKTAIDCWPQRSGYKRRLSGNLAFQLNYFAKSALTSHTAVPYHEYESRAPALLLIKSQGKQPLMPF